MKWRNIILSIAFMLSALSASAQGWNVNWNAETDYFGGTGEYLPFWARTGRNGIVPYSSSALVIGGADLQYKANNGLYFETGANLVGSVESKIQSILHVSTESWTDCMSVADGRCCTLILV